MTEERKFGLLFAGVFTVISAYAWWKGSSLLVYVLAAAGLFLAASFLLEQVLKPIRIVWMRFAHLLGWVNTRILLGLFFYLVITPVGIVMRMFGKDLLERKIDRDSASYWTSREKEKIPQERYERLF